MRRGFTMIELIFVIVIIGILAAIAVPKLAATRDDADLNTQIANARTCLSDVKGYYTSQGKLTNFESKACTKAAVAKKVKAIVTKDAGSEKVVISGVPDDRNNKLKLNGPYDDFGGQKVQYP